MSTPALGIAYKVWTKVAAVEPGSPAAEADIQPGDEITAVKLIPPDKQEADAGEEERNASDAAKLEFDEKDPAWPYFIFEALPFADPDATVRFWVKRGDETRQVDLKPTELKDDSGKTVHTPARGLIFQPLYTLRTAHSVGEAIRLGGHETVDSLLLVYRFLQKIGENQISVKLLGGPVEIARQAGMSAQQGMSSLLAVPHDAQRQSGGDQFPAHSGARRRAHGVFAVRRNSRQAGQRTGGNRLYLCRAGIHFVADGVRAIAGFGPDFAAIAAAERAAGGRPHVGLQRWATNRS